MRILDFNFNKGSPDFCVSKFPDIMIQNSLFQSFIEGILSLLFGTKMTTNFLSIFLIPKPILHLFDSH